MTSDAKEITINIRGNLSGTDSIQRLTSQLDELIGTEIKVINLNMSETDSIESAAITQIIVYKNKFSKENILLRIKGCSNRVKKILTMLKLDSTLSIVE